MRHVFFCILLLLLTITSAAEVVKWVDEKGKTHYGDKAPKKHQNEASVLPLDDVSIVSPEEKVRKQNSIYVDKLKAKDRVRAINSKTEAPTEPEPKSSVMTREKCRDTYSRHLQPKKLVECFLKVEEAKPAKNKK